jgi:hypothetical protein|tara:strand:+ start:5971 stop:6297 length:327 start_codon:yes stop_codon:yes gene_type:complete
MGLNGDLAAGGLAGLCLAVIYRAFVDATAGAGDIHNPRNKKLVQLRAREWLCGEDAGLREICQLADLDQGFLRRRVLEVERLGWPKSAFSIRRRRATKLLSSQRDTLE